MLSTRAMRCQDLKPENVCFCSRDADDLHVKAARSDHHFAKVVSQLLVACAAGHCEVCSQGANAQPYRRGAKSAS